MQDRSAEKGGPLVVKLPKAPGNREQRWAHLLCGPVDLSQPAAGGSGHSSATEDDVIALTRRVQTLETEVDSLRQTLARLCEQLGVET